MSLQTMIDSYTWRISDRKRDQGLTTPSDIERFDDIDFGGGLLLDLYRPRDFEGTLPIIVNVHGGGWFYGNKEVYQFYCMNLAQHGYAVINYNYRLAPRHKFPAQLEDTNLVFKWLTLYASEYSLDMNRLFIIGDSAGAQIAGIYTCMVTNKAYLELIKDDYGAQIEIPSGLNVRALGLNCGIYDARDSRFTRVFIPRSCDMAKAGTDVTVINHVTEKFPPCFIMTGNNDFLRSDAPQMGARLDELGIHNVVREYGDESHSVYHDFQCNIRDEIANKATNDELNFFNEVLS